MPIKQIYKNNEAFNEECWQKNNFSSKQNIYAD